MDTARWRIGFDDQSAATMLDESAATTLVDDLRGTKTRASFVAGVSGRLFTTYHAPTDRPVRAAVLVCPPLMAEAARNYRREVLLGEALAEKGIATLRFHYRAAGHSEDADDVALDDLLDDTRAAARELSSRCGIEDVSFVGTRVGGLVAAMVHRDHGGTPLVLWEPVVDGSAYIRELLRARLMTNLKGAAAGGGMGKLKSDLRAGRSVEVSGYVLTPQLYASLLDQQLDRAVGEPHGPLLVIEMNGRERVRDEIMGLATRWRAAGHSSTTSAIPVDEPWWFGSSARLDTYEAPLTGTALVQQTVAFLDKTLGARS